MIAMMSDIANFITQVTAAIIISPISYSSSYFLSATHVYKEDRAIIALMFIYYPFTRLFWDTDLYTARIVHDLGGSVDQVSRAWVSVDVECGVRIEIVARPVWMFSALLVEYEGVQCDRGYEDNLVVDCLDYSYRDQCYSALKYNLRDVNIRIKTHIVIIIIIVLIIAFSNAFIVAGSVLTFIKLT